MSRQSVPNRAPVYSVGRKRKQTTPKNNVASLTMPHTEDALITWRRDAGIAAAVAAKVEARAPPCP